MDQSPLERDYRNIQLTTVTGKNLLNSLLTISELKKSFTEKQELHRMYFTYYLDEKEIILCFPINSKAYKEKFDVIYAQDGVPMEQCPGRAFCHACLFKEKLSQVAEINHSQNQVFIQSSPTPSPTPSAMWMRADQGSNCIEYCSMQGKVCTDVANSCPNYCGGNSGYVQIEATWATWFGSSMDPQTNETCWTSCACSTNFRYKPLQWYNARCCCQ